MTLIKDLLANMLIRLSGFMYIGQNNLGQILQTPSTWILLIIKGLVIVLAILLELAGMIILYDCSYKGIKIGFFQLQGEVFRAVSKIFKPKNLFLALDLLLFVPFVGLSGISNLGFDITIPGFILDVILKNPLYSLALGLLTIGLYVFLIFRMFGLHAMVIEGMHYSEASRRSKALLKGKFIKTVLVLGIAGLLCGLIVALLVGAGTLIISLICSLMGITFKKSVYYALLVMTLLFVYFYPFILVAMISTLYYRETGVEKGSIFHIHETSVSRRMKVVTVLVISVCVIASLASFVGAGLRSEIILRRPVVGAHRGSSVDAPENTMPAFKLAIEEGVSEWIELDVHQTIDDVVIVSHDDNIKRVSGMDVCVHEMKYDDLMQLDVGSWFSPEFKGLHFSTLDEVLDVCKGKIHVQIEIKPTEFDRHLPEQVADIIRKHGMEKECLVISLKDQPLKTIKAYAPEIKTGYCMYIADGDLTKMDFSDDVTIEEQNATAELTERMHAQHKKVFVWTVNDTDRLQYLVDIGVDGIITDNPVMISQALDKEVDYIGGFAKILRGIMED